MTDDIEQELLELDDLDSNAVARGPPAVRIEGGITCGTNDNCGGVAAEGTVKRPTDPTRMIRGAHHDDGLKAALIAPGQKHVTLFMGPVRGTGNYFNVRDSERPQQLRELCCLVLVGDTTTNELSIRRLRRLGEHGDSAGNAAVHQISRIDGAGRAGPDRHHDDVDRSNRFIDDEHPAKCAQHRATNSRDGADEARQDDHTNDSRPASPRALHALMICWKLRTRN